MNHFSRRLNLKNSVNLRELGGYMREDGKITKYQQYLRSGSLGDLNDKEIRFLTNYGVTTVVDLRTNKELERDPSQFENVKSVKYIHMPLFEADTPRLSEGYNLGMLYMYIFENSTNFGHLFNTLAQNHEGVTLFNCTAGKDRTGITACLLLMLSDIDRSDIIADYQVSFTYFKKAFIKQLEINPDMPQHFAKSNAEWIESFMNNLIQKHGSAENFLLEKSVTKENIEILKNKLI